MKNQKEKILKAISTKHIETIKNAKLSDINGGDGGCVVIIQP